MDLVESYFNAIRDGNLEVVRELLLEHKDLSSAKKRIQGLAWPDEVATDAFKLCGAYIGSVTGLQYAMLIGRDDVAESIVDATLSADIDLTFGGQNTSLHLASLLGAREMVQKLLKRGASQESKNSKGFTALSISDDPEVTSLFASL